MTCQDAKTGSRFVHCRCASTGTQPGRGQGSVLPSNDVVVAAGIYTPSLLTAVVEEIMPGQSKRRGRRPIPHPTADGRDERQYIPRDVGCTMYGCICLVHMLVQYNMRC